MTRRLAFVSMLAVLMAAPAAAQQRPLVTEDPETIGAGNILFEGGFDMQREIFFPVSGLQGDLVRLPVLGFSFGLSSIAELQVDGGLYNRLNVNERVIAPLSSMLDYTGDVTSDIEDIVVATKIRVLSETAGRPALGVRFATKLPNASNENGIGVDTTDFYASLLIGKTVRSARMVGNAGLGILGDPTRGDQQADVLAYGFSVARAVRQGLEVVGEVNGRYQPNDDIEAPPGSDTRAAMRFGARFTTGTVRIDGAVILGMTSRDPSFGLTAGVTWVFRGFTVP